VLSGIYLGQKSPMLLVWIAGFFALSLMIEIGLHLITGRTIQTRAPK